jgi:hypothetical protein
MNKQSRPPTRGGPPAWELGVNLIIPHCKNKPVAKSRTGRRIWTEYLKQITNFIWFKISDDCDLILARFYTTIHKKTVTIMITIYLLTQWECIPNICVLNIGLPQEMENIQRNIGIIKHTCSLIILEKYSKGSGNSKNQWQSAQRSVLQEV